jgi:hypothetical protein
LAPDSKVGQFIDAASDELALSRHRGFADYRYAEL